MPIRWTKTHRKKVGAIRHPHRSDPPVLFPTPESGWAWLHQEYTARSTRGLTINATEDYAAGRDGVVARLSSPTRPTDLTVADELYTMVITTLLHNSMAHNAMPALIAHWSGAGPTFPVQMGGGVAPFAYTGTYGLTATLNLEPLEPNPYGHKSVVRTVGHNRFERQYFSALQRWLFRLPEADFQKARAVAAPLRQALRTSDDRQDQKASTVWSCVFSRDQTWVVEDVNAILDRTLINHNAPWLLGSLTDPALALRFAREGRFGFIFPFIGFSHDIMECLGDDALAVLEALAGRARHLDSRQKRQLASALKLARTAHP